MERRGRIRPMSLAEGIAVSSTTGCNVSKFGSFLRAAGENARTPQASSMYADATLGRSLPSCG